MSLQYGGWDLCIFGLILKYGSLGSSGRTSIGPPVFMTL